MNCHTKKSRGVSHAHSLREVEMKHEIEFIEKSFIEQFLDFFVRGLIKSKTYAMNIYTIEHLKHRISDAVAQITPHLLRYML